MIQYINKRVIEVDEWDKVVEDTYGKPYSLQQQAGCQDRGTINITIPSQADDSMMNDYIPEEVNGEVMGVKFSVWLARDPKQPLRGHGNDGEIEWMIRMFWERNFYPDLQMVANDLCNKGLIETGEYSINIDW